MSETTPMLHRELRDHGPAEGATRDGRRLDHAEGTSQPMSSGRAEPPPRGVTIHGDRPVDQSAAANRFIAATKHEKMHDERLWDMRTKRDHEMHDIPNGRNCAACMNTCPVYRRSGASATAAPMPGRLASS